MKEFIWVDQGDDQALMQALDQYGPLAVALNTNVSNIHLCNKCIISLNKKCDSTNLDHSLLLVGYGWTQSNKTGNPYWKLKYFVILFLLKDILLK